MLRHALREDGKPFYTKTRLTRAIKPCLREFLEDYLLFIPQDRFLRLKEQTEDKHQRLAVYQKIWLRRERQRETHFFARSLAALNLNDIPKGVLLLPALDIFNPLRPGIWFTFSSFDAHSRERTLNLEVELASEKQQFFERESKATTVSKIGVYSLDLSSEAPVRRNKRLLINYMTMYALENKQSLVWFDVQCSVAAEIWWAQIISTSIYPPLLLFVQMRLPAEIVNLITRYFAHVEEDV